MTPRVRWYFQLFIVCMAFALVACYGIFSHHDRYTWGGIIGETLVLVTMAGRLVVEGGKR